VTELEIHQARLLVASIRHRIRRALKPLKAGDEWGIENARRRLYEARGTAEVLVEMLR